MAKQAIRPGRQERTKEQAEADQKMTNFIRMQAGVEPVGESKGEPEAPLRGKAKGEQQASIGSQVHAASAVGFSAEDMSVITLEDGTMQLLIDPEAMAYPKAPIPKAHGGEGTGTQMPRSGMDMNAWIRAAARKRSR